MLEFSQACPFCEATHDTTIEIPICQPLGPDKFNSILTMRLLGQLFLTVLLAVLGASTVWAQRMYDSLIRLSLAPSVQNARPGWLWQVDNEAGPAGLPEPDRLFEKYYRSPSARRLSGSGLGLFLVKGLLNLLQGHIDYTTRDGRAIFNVWLPQQPATQARPPLALVGNATPNSATSSNTR